MVVLEACDINDSSMIVNEYFFLRIARFLQILLNLKNSFLALFLKVIRLTM